MPLTRPIHRPSTDARIKVLDALKADHRRILQAFDEFERMDLRSSPSEAGAIVKRVCVELTIHERIESEFIYPAARSCLPDAEPVDEAEVEHMAARALIERLSVMEPHDYKFAAMFHVLMEYVRHHIRDEERGLLRCLSRAKFDWSTLAIAVDFRRGELTDAYALGFPAEAHPLGEVDDADIVCVTPPTYLPSMARQTRARVGSSSPHSRKV
jgi:hypothetical protein